MVQRYYELLDELYSSPLCIPSEEVVVGVEGQTVKFTSIEAVAEWLKL